MEKKETLRQYLTYNKDTNEMEQIFYNLDSQLKYLHSNGFYVRDLNSDTIFLEENKNYSHNGQSVFMFSSIAKSSNIDKDITSNIKNLSKLAIGAFISIDNGFCDYTNLDNNYIKKYFDEMSYYIPNSEYFRSIVTENDVIMYYSDFISQKNSGGKGNAVQKVKANSYGKMYVNDEEAAFVQIVLYPVLIVTVVAIVAIISRFF